MAPFLARGFDNINPNGAGDSAWSSTNGSSSAAQQNQSQEAQESVTDTHFLIIGAGPAGAALACFLASYGLEGIMISAAPGTANTPRAHITNMAALECLRDIGLYEEVESLASKGDAHMQHTRWCHSMAGEEYARIHSWGNDPRRKGDYEMASPCAPFDLPQTALEPVLVRHATWKGFKSRFNTTLVSFVDGPKAGRITATVRDNISTKEYEIRTRYLFGADGARSQVVKQLNLPLCVKPSQGLAINVLVKADLSHLVKHRQGNLHWVMQPDRDHPDFAWMGIVRMVKPWNEWMFILFPTRSYELNKEAQPSKEEYLRRVQEFIGDDTPAEILDISKWYINEAVAETYSKGNVFCPGDAVHRHPPLNGLGSNTCIQDAFNLAWKIAYVHKGLASPSLLSTYSTERRPVGYSVITRANQALRDHHRIWDALGMLPTELAARTEILRELASATPEGKKRRLALHEAIKHTAHEFHGLGIEMNQHYDSRGIYVADEPHPYVRAGQAAENGVLYHEPSTYPGCRLPHAWLNTAIPRQRVSTIDIAGHGAFTLFTGIGGDAWKQSAENVAGVLQVPLKVHSIGFRQEWEDAYFDWERVRGVEESGAVLVLPDRFVAWRTSQAFPDARACESKLMTVMRSILGRQWV
ncbi:2,4-dichlorophenol 6-monooxygenase [Tolypocladium ophioglossoides CBS 100239]|uniref:2,4-dichlorophenol 6-monooxygenase n=1 Tax=Tolypocladium ophioglossoides (strain CBS 100239) TaxID=1163406 RepID=A0A0L0NG79_TOLOC|nr:2,4-dichlorophenol 6-monooxygenase [Tolypocladium ophioglossoides CBS 100239]